MQRHAEGAGAFAEQRYVAGIAAESPDVRLHPLQAHELVEEAGVARSRRRVQREEAERPHPVADADHDDVVGAGDDFAVVERQRGGAAVGCEGRG